METPNLKVEFLYPKLSDDKNDSFWYYGKEIAKVSLPNGKSLYAESSGELEIEGLGKGEEAVKVALEKGYNDSTFDKITNKVKFFNWFRIVLVDIDGNTEEELGICGEYDNAIADLLSQALHIYSRFYS